MFTFRKSADLESAHQTSIACHLANIAWRAGNRTLAFDPQTETFPDYPEANQYLKRNYRAPWKMPEVG